MHPVTFHFKQQRHDLAVRHLPRSGELVVIGKDWPVCVVLAVMHKAEESGATLETHVMLKKAKESDVKLHAKFDNVPDVPN
jgi:predicted ATP-grasp superfamily ATP-dependent carboligase